MRPFDPGQASFRLTLYRDDSPLLIDRWQINTQQDLQGAASLRNHPVEGSWLATGADQAILEQPGRSCRNRPGTPRAHPAG